MKIRIIIPTGKTPKEIESELDRQAERQERKQIKDKVYNRKPEKNKVRHSKK